MLTYWKGGEQEWHMETWVIEHHFRIQRLYLLHTNIDSMMKDFVGISEVDDDDRYELKIVGW